PVFPNGLVSIMASPRRNSLSGHLTASPNIVHARQRRPPGRWHGWPVLRLVGRGLRPPTAGGLNTGCRGHPCPLSRADSAAGRLAKRLRLLYVNDEIELRIKNRW